MIRPSIFFLLLTILLVSCKKRSEEEAVPEYVTERDQMPTLKSDAPIVGLNPDSEELVKDWPEYEAFSSLIVQFREISKADALLNSDELEEAARYLKDSIRVEKLDIPPVRMRLNVLHNEAKRLSDMSTIPTITSEEVLEENNNVLEAYAALNIKINDLGKQERINRELARFDNPPPEAQDSIKSQDNGEE